MEYLARLEITETGEDYYRYVLQEELLDIENGTWRRRGYWDEDPEAVNRMAQQRKQEITEVLSARA